MLESYADTGVTPPGVTATYTVVKAVLAIASAVIAVLLALVFVLGAAFATHTATPTPATSAEIPPYLLRAYMDAAGTCPGLTWDVLAAIGYLESRHADGRADPLTGDVQPPIVGPPLDGMDGRAAIADPSEPDGWAHAHGPMQFLKPTWITWGIVAPGRPIDASPDYDNAYDSISSAANYLCGPTHQIDDIRAAILRYNPSDTYVTQVLNKAADYRTANPGGGHPSIVGDYALPVNRAVFDAHPDYLTAPHHDYPAIDIPVPSGSPVYAVTTGIVVAITRTESSCGNGVVLDGDDGFRYTLCHGQFTVATTGDRVVAGELVMFSGSTGASSGPHVHLQIQTPAGEFICPQPLLAAWYAGSPLPPPGPDGACVS